MRTSLKHYFKAILLCTGLASPLFAGPSQPPAGNYIANTSTNSARQVFNVSSGTIKDIRITGTCTGAGCGGGSGTFTGLNASGQPNLASSATFVAGTNVTLSQTGSSITITAAGGTGPSGSITPSSQFQIGQFSATGSSNVITGISSATWVLNQSSLQSGATFFVSSGTIAGGNFYVNSNPALATAPFPSTGTITIITPSQSSSAGGINYQIQTGTTLPDFVVSVSSASGNPQTLRITGASSSLYDGIYLCTQGLIYGNSCISQFGGTSFLDTAAADRFTTRYGVTAASVTIGGATATPLGGMLTLTAPSLSLQAGLNSFLSYYSTINSSGPIHFSADGTPANWSSNTDLTISSIGISAPQVIAVSSFSGAGLSACGDGTHALSWSGGVYGCQTLSGTGGSGSSTTTVHINGTTLSSSATDFTFISGTGGVITGSSSTANAVSLTFSVDSVVFLSKITDQAGTDKKCISTTGNTTYTCALNPTLTVYSTGTCLTLYTDTSNTTSATLNVDTLGAFPIVNSSGGALSAGNITANQPATVCLDYSNTHWVLQGGVGASNFANLTVTSTATIKSLTLGTTDFGVLNSSPTITPDARLGNNVWVTLGSTITINGPSNPVDGQKMVFRFTQDATGGHTANTFALGAGNFSFGTDITSVALTTTAAAVDYVGAIYNSTKNRWHIVAVTKGF